MGKLLSSIGRLLAWYLNKETHHHGPVLAPSAAQLMAVLRPGDVLLVEGNRRFSTAIKYLTQSTWSHAALFLGEEHDFLIPPDHCFIEADAVEGVRTVAVKEYEGHNIRICRPVGLSREDASVVIDYAMRRLGHQYDLRNVIDLARYLIATPPVPLSYRRRMIALGSGDPTRAICSTLIAQAFQSIRYPILPIVEQISRDSPEYPGCIEEIMRIRHHSLFVPRDFDISPYFEIVKPTLADGFHFKTLHWIDNPPG